MSKEEKKNNDIIKKLSYTEMKQYLEFLDECMIQLVENKIVFNDFDSALRQQKATVNPFIIWALNNYKNSLILGLCKMLEGKKRDNQTLKHFINSLRLEGENQKILKHELERATVKIHSLYTGTTREENVGDFLLEEFAKIDFEKDIEKIEKIHNKIKDYRNIRIAHQIQSGDERISIPDLNTLNGYIDDLLKIIKQYHPLFRYSIDFGENRKNLYGNFHLSLSSSMPDIELDKDQKKSFDLVENTEINLFIQGQAGTGKSTFINYLKKHSDKRMTLICPTAIAAINIGGATIHSLFRLPLSDFFMFDELLKEKRPKLKSILKKTDLLIIDEISMVRADMFDAIDLLSQQARGNNDPFGGLQMLVIGDLCQLPPVIKSNTYQINQDVYGHRMPYFFDSNAYKKGCFTKVELTKVYRQSDKELLQNLIKIRKNEDVESAVEYFNTCKIDDEEILNTAMTITPYKSVAESINQKRLGELDTPVQTYVCQTKGIFDEAKECPAPRVLTLKVGALVILNKNNRPQWINGTSGIIEVMGNDTITVRVLKTGISTVVKREKWQSFKYDYDKENGKVVETEIGSFIQFPLQLGYALTIHKAQGKTLDKVIIDINRGTFAHGQLYVALSRTRKKEDIHITKRIDDSDVIIDPRISEFLKT